ncbi:FHA domain-containing protein [Nocardioides sp. cx-169]|uniref:FHA domain-containing protein n=1 Tax=Nocardioides sp. cx-169 TaxID=2899080 RepID=UPI001E62370F|nr:FHA domain-containing protein [Nocardioides sp. cx-169]MCD4536172.1 FHA domain-containing protein [Nocardioides sp. cx-169]
MTQDVSTWSYRPGDWLAIFGAATTLLLPASEKARAAQLWDKVDGGAGFAETLDGVVAPGLSALPAFVLIGTGEGPTKVIVRGAGVRATLSTSEDTVVLDGSTATIWHERSLEGVTALSVEVEDAPSGPDYRIEGGLVRVSRLDLPPHGADAPAPPAVVEQPQTERLDVPAHAAALDGEEEPADADTGDLGDGESRGLSLMEPVPEADSEPDTSGLVWADEGGSEPIGAADPSGGPLPPLPPPPMPGVAPVPGPPPADATTPPASAAPHTDHDGLTQAGASTGEFAREQPGIPGQPPAPQVTRPVARLVISNGDTVEVDRVVLIGRAPEARRFTATEQPRLITVPSPLHEISSTHVEVRPGSGADHGSAVVTDMGSTNGTVLVQPGLGPEDLKPGIAVQLIPGAIINLGDGVTIQVTNP